MHSSTIAALPSLARSLAGAVLALSLLGCAPLAADDGTTAGELNRVVPGKAGLPITLNAANPTARFSFTCDEHEPDGCYVKLDFGFDPKPFLSYYDMLSFTDQYNLKNYKTLFSLARDGHTKAYAGWYIPAGCYPWTVESTSACPRGTQYFDASSYNEVLAPGTYEFTVSRASLLPNAPDMQLSVTASSRRTDCSAACQKTAPSVAAPVPTTLVVGSIVDALAVDGQPVPLSDEPVRLRWSDVQPAGSLVAKTAADYTTSTLYDGSFSLDNVQLGNYELVIGNRAIQLAVDQSPLYDLGQLIE